MERALASESGEIAGETGHTQVLVIGSCGAVFEGVDP